MEGRIISLQADGLNLAGRVYFPAAKGPAPALCICHGIPTAQYEPMDRRYPALAERFCAAGFVTLIFNFRGAGQSQGNFDILGWTRDLRAALDHLVALDEVDGARLCLMGSSGGGAVSVCVAADDPRVRCLVLLACPADFDTVLEPGHAKPMVDYMRSVGLIRDKGFPASAEAWVEGFRVVRPVDCIERISPRPVLIVHGEGDTTVPVEQARRLYARAKEPKELVIMPGGSHRLRLEEAAVNTALDWLRKQTRVR